ncbi:hypothetical protein GE21DRAFT_7716 [Neurospora crassa]|uniref:Uncharacterized protein n=2 Tax=Neurospora crassa TaxID=5141 RepID=A7UWD7_NEUCR|nr:hypothetical protein NCU11151 [Neurospora crassa OR74A]EDO65227.1 hypothetical protein NCU11151 [Neurospora crassa OR74A]KHE78927.1 hypothetical protein GE21DRAFT_7716 [Neurospora crassa]CAD70856.1 hypothetical protein [Neurospora crassa]|eukprot:XP_001728318.1 hypothetical protein NCU11151 [Neurospora crassa OR74A]
MDGTERVGGKIAMTGSLLAREWRGRDRRGRTDKLTRRELEREATSLVRCDWSPNCRNDQTGTMNHGPSRGWNVIDQSGKRDATSAVVCLQGPPAA